MQERWIKWEPFSDLPKYYWMTSFFRTPGGGLKITFIEDSNKSRGINIIFQPRIIGYLHTNESFRIATFSIPLKKYGADFFHHWSFFKIENSILLKSLASNVDKTVSINLPMHFVFLSGDDVLDVIALREPQFEHFNIETGSN